MECPNCKSDKVRFHDKNYTTNKVRMKCSACDHSWSMNKSDVEMGESKPKVGMSLTDFREKFDVDYIVKKTLDNLDPNIIYEKNDIIKLTGLRPGYPGLSPTIEDKKNYYGKVGSTMYFSHPDTILKLKNDAKLN